MGRSFSVTKFSYPRYSTVHVKRARAPLSIHLFTVYDAILAGGQTRLKIKVNVWDFGPLGTAITPLQRGGFSQRKCIFKDICTVIILMKYKEEIQVITTVNDRRFHTLLINIM